MCLVRKATALALALAVQTAGLTAPFVHAHPDDHATDHHDAHAVHAHFAGHQASHHSTAPNGLSVETDDNDRAVYVNAFVALAVTSFSIPAAIVTTFELPVPAERAAHRPVDVSHGHDPPAFGSQSPRAPPLFLS